MGLVLLVGPAAPVVSLEEAQVHLRSEIAEETSLILSLVAAATAQAEAYCRRRFVTQRWRANFDGFPAGALLLPHPPLASVETVTYVDRDGVVQTLEETLYVARTAETPGEIVPAYGTRWPATRQVIDAVAVEFTCGYGEPDAVPDSVKRAVHPRPRERRRGLARPQLPPRARQPGRDGRAAEGLPGRHGPQLARRVAAVREHADADVPGLPHRVGAVVRGEGADLRRRQDQGHGQDAGHQLRVAARPRGARRWRTPCEARPPSKSRASRTASASPGTRPPPTRRWLAARSRTRSSTSRASGSPRNRSVPCSGPGSRTSTRT
ncbi:MAG: hypothetical protein K8T90_01740 [Planctomycetes bacterium]|nr:hypothetical protein [Planctomycetota bacterium]